MDTKRKPKRSQNDAKNKKAPQKVFSAEQDRTNLGKGCEKDANVCRKAAKMEPTSMPKVIGNQ